ncbi:hypothetical protein OSB04_006516 [Centaurea solstitialis]|uniref:Uncharacterized protein n=1 Tax=Centaurea solstitialis TaxID=347529 RepID=A0AA38TTM5_9ASTR|nr:hypothetical protein OSB04_006516 [Centaurea solstitialis]
MAAKDEWEHIPSSENKYPHIIKRPLGRPKKNIIVPPDEPKRRHKCRRFSMYRHHERTCKNSAPLDNTSQGVTLLLAPAERVARPPWITPKTTPDFRLDAGAGSFACATAPELSQNISIGLEILATTLRSDRKFLSQTASFAASHAAMYSASVVESAIVSCFELFHEIAPPFRVKTYPDCDLKSSLSV